MTQLSVMELAKQGDPHAIAALINRSLASKGIHAEAQLEAECLKISLYAAQIPNQKAVITIIHRGMMILQVRQIERVKILTYRSDNNYLAWQHEIFLADSFEKSLLIPETNQADDLGQDQEMNLVSNSKGVILVQKLSQIQQNLQEYQDVIVRFTDEHVGTVRCLTTLTELIQVISKPSFLFAAVASNPNLRSLLDTIAESSHTDEHGDQVITNLSILQPGQQWQKAKIRLVTKIFLEPAQEQDNNAKDKHQGLTLDLEELDQEPAKTTPQSLEELNKKSNEELNIVDADLDIPNLDISQNISEGFSANEVPDAITMVADSLFDDFPVSSSLTPQIIDDVTEIPNLSDSLFDEFMDNSSSNSYSEVIDDKTEFANNLVNETLSKTLNKANEDNDLFDNFSLEEVRSHVPTSSDSDFGATTIDNILGNNKTTHLNGSGATSSADFVTLEEFLEDIQSF